MSQLVINATFCGPPGLGNGGYVAGMLAKDIDYDCEITLKKPTPLDKELNRINTAEGIDLMDGEQVIATLSKATIDIVPPPPMSFDKATLASEKFIGHHGKHPFPNCFVCGPARPNGLRIFVGQLEDTNIYAAPWQPAAHLTESDNHVNTEFVWAALDCPGAFAIWKGAPMATLLGKIKAKISSTPKASERCTIQAWLIESEGRKHRCGTALYNEQGQAIAIADALWISPKT